MTARREPVDTARDFVPVDRRAALQLRDRREMRVLEAEARAREARAHRRFEALVTARVTVDVDRRCRRARSVVFCDRTQRTVSFEALAKRIRESGAAGGGRAARFPHMVQIRDFQSGLSGNLAFSRPQSGSSDSALRIARVFGDPRDICTSRRARISAARRARRRALGGGGGRGMVRSQKKVLRQKDTACP